MPDERSTPRYGHRLPARSASIRSSTQSLRLPPRDTLTPPASLQLLVFLIIVSKR
ncbi:hypothetical protein MD484_g7459, partial [Candolleomyces efflorescens]